MILIKYGFDQAKSPRQEAKLSDTLKALMPQTMQHTNLRSLVCAIPDRVAVLRRTPHNIGGTDATRTTEPNYKKVYTYTRTELQES